MKKIFFFAMAVFSLILMATPVYAADKEYRLEAADKIIQATVNVARLAEKT